MRAWLLLLAVLATFQTIVQVASTEDISTKFIAAITTKKATNNKQLEEQNFNYNLININFNHNNNNNNNNISYHQEQTISASTIKKQKFKKNQPVQHNNKKHNHNNNHHQQQQHQQHHKHHNHQKQKHKQKQKQKQKEKHHRKDFTKTHFYENSLSDNLSEKNQQQQQKHKQKLKNQESNHHHNHQNQHQDSEVIIEIKNFEEFETKPKHHKNININNNNNKNHKQQQQHPQDNHPSKKVKNSHQEHLIEENLKVISSDISEVPYNQNTTDQLENNQIKNTNNIVNNNNNNNLSENIFNEMAVKENESEEQQQKSYKTLTNSPSTSKKTTEPSTVSSKLSSTTALFSKDAEEQKPLSSSPSSSSSSLTSSASLSSATVIVTEAGSESKSDSDSDSESKLATETDTESKTEQITSSSSLSPRNQQQQEQSDFESDYHPETSSSSSSYLTSTSSSTLTSTETISDQVDNNNNNNNINNDNNKNNNDKDHTDDEDDHNDIDDNTIHPISDIDDDDLTYSNRELLREKVKPDPTTLVEIENSLLSLFNMKRPPTIDRSKIVIPDAMKALYAQMMGQQIDSVNIPKPGLLTKSANTVRSFTHKDSKIDDRFPHHHRFRLHFDIKTIPGEEKLKAAELQLSRDAISHAVLNPRLANRTRYQVLVYDITRVGIRGKREPSYLLLDNKTIRLNSTDTVSLDVQPAVDRWLASPNKNYGLLVEVRTTRSLKPAPHHHVRLRRSADETQDSWLRKQPLLFTYTDDGRHKSRSIRDVSNRSKRAGHNKRNHRRKNTEETCHRKELYVDFSDVGWSNWILAPPGYEAFYCHGKCPFPLAEHFNSTNHAVVQTLVNNINPEKVPKPCCVPTQLEGISMLYLNDQNSVVLKNYQDMRVVGCGCR